MNPPVEKLLFAAASLLGDAKERRELLDYACRDDAALRERLIKLLEVQAAADTFFEFQPEVHADPVDDAAEEEGMGAHIGRYRLITRIGAGGCGTVYLAEQEEPVRRKVALKIIKLGMDTKAVIARFGLERQALAQMDHPNIARVLDAGATASGRPYFVMELVEGEKITDFCDENQFSIRQRLELFVELCRAIQHAHQKGIIHRDIKPSNLLVRWSDGAPAPKVIDFGIAKATGDDLAMESASAPQGQFIGTPAYMSPEQARGDADVDTRCDIYSLGVLLYELVSGLTPFDPKLFANVTMNGLRRVIQQEEPKLPSAAFKEAMPEERVKIAENRGMTSQHLATLLAGDLDWIVMKAIEKERLQRYDTATGLAMDVKRILNDQPVLARPASSAYLLGKWVRRNKLIFLAGSIAFFGLVAGLGTSTWMFFQEREARLEESRLLQKAEYREQVAQAAVKIKYEDLEGADQLLARVPIDQTPSSLEAADTFRAVAEWHVRAGRLNEAASGFTAMIRALSSVDNSDLPSVSLRLLEVAAPVAYSGGAQPYEVFRRFAIDRFGTTANATVAEETLKACLLLPADKKTLQSLQSLAPMVQRAIEAKGGDEFWNAWALFALSLLHYRTGDYPEAARLAERCLSSPNQNEVRTATMLIVYAMIEQRIGQFDNAQAALTEGRAAVELGFSREDWKTLNGPLFWFDWINTLVLLDEAERLIDSKVEDLAWFGRPEEKK